MTQTTQPVSKDEIEQALLNLSESLSDKGRYFNLQISRYRWICQQVASRFPRGAKIADIGAAPGHISILLADLGYRVTALDFKPDLNYWETNSFAGALSTRNIKLEHWDIEVQEPTTVPAGPIDGEFDCAIFTEVLEHVYRFPFATVRQISHLLKPGGELIITTPNRGALVTRLRALLAVRHDAPMYTLEDHFPPHMRHVWVYTPEEVEMIMQRSHFDIVHSTTESFYLWTTFISHNHVLPYWKPVDLKHAMKPLLAAILSLCPKMRSAICVIGRKRPQAN